MTTSPYLYLAPLRGITDVTFRQVFARHFGGFDMAIAPFINPQRSPSNKQKLLADLLPEDNREFPVIPQLLNNRLDDFLHLAGRLEDLGYTRLNWNLGCPAPMVANKGRGSGLLPFPDEIIRLLDGILPRLNARLSIKMRLGFHDKSESLALLPRLEDFPLEEIIIHPRIGKQMYKGNTDLDGFAACLEHTSHTVVFNGDITSRESYEELAGRFPSVSRWMIGRGVLADPLLAEELKSADLTDAAERAGRIIAFHNDLMEMYRQRLSGPGHLLGKMKQLWLYLVFSFPGRDKAFKKLKKARTEEQLLAAIAQMFAG